MTATSLLLPMLLVYSLGQPAPVPTPPSTFSQAIESFTSDPALRGTRVSVSVVDVKTNTLLAGYQSDEALIPASSLKVVTTASALALLGENFRYRTDLLIDGTVENGVLRGDVIIFGSGDPTLGSGQWDAVPDMDAVLDAFVAAIRKEGIQQIDGYVIGDASFFGNDPTAPSWEEKDMGNYYASGAWGLNLNENLCRVHFRQQARIGGKPILEDVEPVVPGLKLDNRVSLAGRNTGDEAYIHGKPRQYNRYITGTIPAGNGRFTIKGSIPDPPAFAAHHLRERLIARGITVGKKALNKEELLLTGYAGRNAKKRIHRIESPILRGIITEANLYSNNLYCEALLRTMGRMKQGQGTRAGGQKAIRQLWEGRGLSFQGMAIEDGSGLSAMNRVSSRFLASVMRKVAVDDQLFSTFLASLPKAGQSGTLSNRLRNTAAVGKLWAKSGAIDGVRSYTGFARLDNGNWISFSVLVNNIPEERENTVRNKMDQLMLAFCQ